MNSHKFLSWFAPKVKLQNTYRKKTPKTERLQPDNCLFVDVFPFLRGHFRVPAVSFRVWILKLVALKWVFPKIGVPQNGWFIMENPIKNGWFGGKTHYFRKHPNPQVVPWIFMFLALPMQDLRTAGSLGSWREKKTWRTYVDTSQQRKRWATPTRMRLETLKGRLNFSKTRESRKGWIDGFFSACFETWKPVVLGWLGELERKRTARSETYTS